MGSGIQVQNSLTALVTTGIAQEPEAGPSIVTGQYLSEFCSGQPQTSNYGWGIEDYFGLRQRLIRKDHSLQVLPPLFFQQYIRIFGTNPCLHYPLVLEQWQHTNSRLRANLNLGIIYFERMWLNPQTKLAACLEFLERQAQTATLGRLEWSSWSFSWPSRTFRKPWPHLILKTRSQKLTKK